MLLGSGNPRFLRHMRNHHKIKTKAAGPQSQSEMWKCGNSRTVTTAQESPLDGSTWPHMAQVINDKSKHLWKYTWTISKNQPHSLNIPRTLCTLSNDSILSVILYPEVCGTGVCIHSLPWGCHENRGGDVALAICLESLLAASETKLSANPCQAAQGSCHPLILECWKLHLNTLWNQPWTPHFKINTLVTLRGGMRDILGWADSRHQGSYRLWLWKAEHLISTLEAHWQPWGDMTLPWLDKLGEQTADTQLPALDGCEISTLLHW